MRPVRALLAGAAVLTLVAACASTSDQPADQPPPSLSGTSWILDEVAVEGMFTAAVDANASLNFAADGSLSGSTGCNRITGTWQAEGDTLTITTGGMTMMACPGALQAQETAVLAALADTAGYAVSEDTLTLSNADGDDLARYSAAATGLAGTSWAATGVNNGNNAVVSEAGTGDLTLLFGTDGTATGFAGCTNYTGSFTASGPAISITGLAADGQCADPATAARQEQYLNALAAATNYSIDGNRLDLRDEAGALQAGFTATP